MEKTIKKLVLAAIILCCISLNSIAAELELKQEEKEPTYDETVNFLVSSKFPSGAFDKHSFDSFDSCNMKTTITNPTWKDDPTTYTKYTVDLREVTIKVDCEKSHIWIDSNIYPSVITENEDRYYRGDIKRYVTYPGFMTIHKKNCDDIKRIAKALSHLQKLCRPEVKPSPF